MKRLTAIIISVLLVIGVFVFAGCSDKKSDDPAETRQTATVPAGDTADGDAQDKTEKAADDAAEPADGDGTYDFEGENPIVTITMQDGSVIKVELYPEEAPNTVANFISLAEKGFFDGLTFHRIIKGFMIQGGDPAGNGTGGPGYGIKGEFAANGVENNVKHVRGTISMGRTSFDLDSAGSQFFICQEAYEYGDGQYAAFGKVTEGMDVVDKIADVDTDASDHPYPDDADIVTMKTVTVETFGFDFPEPVTVKG